MKVNNHLMADAHVLMHPTRFRIAQLLSEKPMHIRELSEALEKEKRLVSYHLFILEEHGFVNGEFKFPEMANSMGIATNHYGMTKKGRFSYNLFILDKDMVGADKYNPFEPLELKREMVREYSATEKVVEVLSELKKSLG